MAAFVLTAACDWQLLDEPWGVCITRGMGRGKVGNQRKPDHAAV
jgi:hypothetical protein